MPFDSLPSHVFPADAFADLMAANEEYARDFQDQHLSGRAAKGLAVVTCMDSRLNPLAILGMKPGDVKLLRNAGARVTEDVLRTLVLASWLLGVKRVLVMAHTDCRMASGSEQDIHKSIFLESGVDTRGIEIRTVEDQEAALKLDVQRIRSFPLLPELQVGGVIYDVHTGRLTSVDC